MRTQTPAPSPNNVPSRTTTPGETGLRSRKMSQRCWREMPRSCAISALVFAGRRNHALPQQRAGVGRAKIRIALRYTSHDRLSSELLLILRRCAWLARRRRALAFLRGVAFLRRAVLVAGLEPGRHSQRRIVEVIDK